MKIKVIVMLVILLMLLSITAVKTIPKAYADDDTIFYANEYAMFNLINELDDDTNYNQSLPPGWQNNNDDTPPGPIESMVIISVLLMTGVLVYRYAIIVLDNYEKNSENNPKNNN
jgi:hypothetical protein